MAIKLIGNYAKRLGLPGYSSHQFSVSIETELSDNGDIQGEAARIYNLLQDAVDQEIQKTGFVPGDEYGLNNTPALPNGSNGVNGNNGHNGNHSHNGNGSNGNGDRPVNWSCSDKQRGLIEKLIKENNLDRNEVEELAQDRFGVSLPLLNKLQASGLIAELIERAAANKPQRNGSYQKGGSR